MSNKTQGKGYIRIAILVGMVVYALYYVCTTDINWDNNMGRVEARKQGVEYYGN